MSIMDKIALICSAPQMEEPSYHAVPKTDTKYAHVFIYLTDVIEKRKQTKDELAVHKCLYGPLGYAHGLADIEKTVTEDMLFRVFNHPKYWKGDDGEDFGAIDSREAQERTRPVATALLGDLINGKYDDRICPNLKADDPKYAIMAFIRIRSNENELGDFYDEQTQTFNPYVQIGCQYGVTLVFYTRTDGELSFKPLS